MPCNTCLLSKWLHQSCTYIWKLATLMPGNKEASLWPCITGARVVWIFITQAASVALLYLTEPFLLMTKSIKYQPYLENCTIDLLDFPHILTKHTGQFINQLQRHASAKIFQEFFSGELIWQYWLTNNELTDGLKKYAHGDLIRL